MEERNRNGRKRPDARTIEVRRGETIEKKNMCSTESGEKCVDGARVPEHQTLGAKIRRNSWLEDLQGQAWWGLIPRSENSRSKDEMLQQWQATGQLN